MTVQRAEHDGGVVALRQGEVEVSTSLQRFAADGAAAMQMALQIAPTPFVPESYKKKNRDEWYTAERIAQNVAAAWLAGAEIGLRPMQALQAIDIIEGRPALNALSMRALVQAAGHEIWTEKAPQDGVPVSQLAATVCGRREGSEHVERSEWSWHRAQRANLTGKKNWERHGPAMLVARATSEICRRIGADVLLGLAYSAEELADEVEPVETPAAVTVRRGSSVRRQQPEADPFEGVDGEERPAIEQGAPTSEPIVESAWENARSRSQEQVERLDSLAAQGEQPASAEVPDGDRCQATAGDGRRCQREDDHDGRHFFGRRDAAPAATTQPVETPEEGAGERTETPESPAVTTFEPSPEERADQEGGDDALFPEPTDAELEAALEAERAEQAAREAQQAAAGVPEGAPAAETSPQAGDDAGDDLDDDPWSDFR